MVNLHLPPQSSPGPIKDKGAQSKRSETGSDGKKNDVHREAEFEAKLPALAFLAVLVDRG